MSFGVNLTLLIGPTLPVPAPLPLIESLQSIEVTNTDQSPDGFQITFAVGRGSAAADMLDYSVMNSPLLQAFSRVIIIVTFGVTPRVLIDGIITNRQLTPSQGLGESTFAVTGEDTSVMMDLEEKVQTFPNMSDDVIVNRIILSYTQYGLVPNIVPPESLDVPMNVDRIPTFRGTDLSCIRELTTKNGYVFYIEPTDVPGVNSAYWGPPRSVSSMPQTPALSVNMGPATNVASINFQVNALRPQLIVGNVRDRITNTISPIQTLESTRPPLSAEPTSPANMPNIRKSLLNGCAKTISEAQTIAQAETDNSFDSVVAASGELDSMVYGDVLRARKLVGLRGAGYSHDGTYFVNAVTHHIKLGEYRQSFTLSREGLGSITPVVPL